MNYVCADESEAVICLQLQLFHLMCFIQYSVHRESKMSRLILNFKKEVKIRWEEMQTGAIELNQ